MIWFLSYIVLGIVIYSFHFYNLYRYGKNITLEELLLALLSLIVWPLIITFLLISISGDTVIIKGKRK